MENTARCVTIHVEPIPVVPFGAVGDPRHIHALQFPTDEIKWDPLFHCDEDIEAAARTIGISVDESRARISASDEKRRERYRGPPADDVPLAARYEELREQWASGGKERQAELRKTLERHLSSGRTFLRLGGEPLRDSDPR
jgi:hypothetical protein